jgi:sugar/nucleoside kinase (ribokinase family)/fructoselysine-6-P-deglycase FrlB-like protein
MKIKTLSWRENGLRVIKMKFDVLGMGLVAVDHTFLKTITPDHKTSSKYLGSAGGGSVGNTLSFLGALGFKTAIIGAIGNDIQSEIIKQDFKNFGVNTRWLIQRGGAGQFRRSRQYFHVISESNHSHKFLPECPACKAPISRSVVLNKRDITKEMLEAVRKCQIVHIDRANDSSLMLARTASKANKFVSFDFSFDSFESARSKAQELISIATTVKVNSRIFKNFLKQNKLESLDAFSQLFERVKLLIVTDSEQGVYGFIRGPRLAFQKFKYPALKCLRLCDTAGAGDILIGATLAQILKKSIRLEIGFEEQMLSVAQGLASLSCSFYGARSYSRILAANKVSAAEALVLGAEVAHNGQAFFSLPPSSGIPEPFKFPFRFRAYDVCQICGEPRATGTKRNKSLLSEKLARKNGFGAELAQVLNPMFNPIMETYSQVQFQLLNSKKKAEIESMIKSMPLLFVGSGGSLSAAVFGEQVVFSLRGNPAMAIPPYELESIRTPLNNILPVLISYRGSNPDILYSFDKLRALKVTNGLVFTSDPDSELTRRAGDSGWQVFIVSKHRQGFVATLGYLATLGSLLAIFAPDNLKEDLHRLFDYKTLSGIFKAADFRARGLCEGLSGLPSNYHFIALGSGWARPALVDLESKFVEGGIATIECSELKNFTHGRYISAYRHSKNRIAVILRCPPYNDLADMINKKLKKQMKVFELSTDCQSVLGAIDLVIQALYLTHHLGLREGVDISKPKYPKEARGMYSWTPKEPINGELD